MRILVTGGNGMIGMCMRSLDDEYSDDFIFTSRTSRFGKPGLDLMDKSSVENFFNVSEKFDYIIHLAANVGGLYKNMNENDKMYEDNVKMNRNIIEACHKYGIKRGIFVLSSCIYTPNPSKFPMDETMIHEGPPHPSNSGYANAKRDMEKLCRSYNETGAEYICVIPVNLYGPHDNFDMKDGHFIPAIMNRWHKAKLRGENKFIAYGTGKPERQLLYAIDFCRIIMVLLLDAGEKKRYDSTEPIIICNDEEKTIKEIVNELAKVMGIEQDKIEWDTSKSDGCMKKTVSNEKLKKVLKNVKTWEFNTFTKIRMGFFKTYNWYKRNYGIARGTR